MIHKSGISPRGHAVLLRPYEVAKKGLIAIPENYKDRQALLENRGIVEAIGAAAWDDESAPRAYIGDMVVTPKFVGNMIEGPLDGILYRIVNDNDIFCVVAEKENE